MKVFAILIDRKAGVQLAGVCGTYDHARQCIANAESRSASRVEETDVLGAQDDPCVVYSAEYYRQDLDIHCFKGVYGKFANARRAAGMNGLVTKRRVATGGGAVNRS